MEYFAEQDFVLGRETLYGNALHPKLDIAEADIYARSATVCIFHH
tara:strand:- start:193 stop:327 length:135 start_codon:yes stop_codon:yes gene_type:complete